MNRNILTKTFKRKATENEENVEKIEKKRKLNEGAKDGTHVAKNEAKLIP